MITITLIILSLMLLIAGKMPLLGGKIIRGAKVRYAGASLLALSVCSFFLSAKLSLAINFLVLAAMGGAYFFIKGEDPNENEAKTMLFTSAQEEKKVYSSAIVGLIIFAVVILCFSGVAWLLLNLIRS